MTYVVRPRANAAALIPDLRDAIWATDPEQPIYHSDTIEGLVGATLVEHRFHLGLLGALAVVSLALSVIGIHGLIRFVTEQRRGEISVRIALGARRADVTRMIVTDALRLVVPGIAIGTAAALALTRSLRSMLYEITPADPLTFVQLAALMLLVGVAAAYGPAARAAATEPMSVLRQE